MSEAPIMPFYTDAYLADCHHLSAEAHGAYLLILLHTWRRGGKPLPDDDAQLMPIVKIRSRARWKKLKSELAPFFDLSGGAWRQKKLERTWAEVIRKVEINRANGKSRKGAKRNNATPATASISPPPSMNHEPSSKIHEPFLKDEKEFDMMLEAAREAKHSATLDSVRGLLSDASYFLPRSSARVPHESRPQLERALSEINARLKPVSDERLKQIISRLMLHFPCPAGEKAHRVFADYASMLSEFPEDLLCASYQHALMRHKYHTLPKIADLIAIMEPELAHRKATRRKLEILLSRIDEENA